MSRRMVLRVKPERKPECHHTVKRLSRHRHELSVRVATIRARDPRRYQGIMDLVVFENSTQGSYKVIMHSVMVRVDGSCQDLYILYAE